MGKYIGQLEPDAGQLTAGGILIIPENWQGGTFTATGGNVTFAFSNGTFLLRAGLTLNVGMAQFDSVEAVTVTVGAGATLDYIYYK